jgi:hypothetical protein
MTASDLFTWVRHCLDMNTTLVAILLQLVQPQPSETPCGGSENVICCGVDENGNMDCHPAGTDGCESGEKAVVCRYGFWSDPISGTAECWPTP